MYNKKNHSFDMSIDNNNEIQSIERSSFYAMQGSEGPKGEPGFDCAGTVGTWGTAGGSFGTVGSFGCCC